MWLSGLFSSRKSLAESGILKGSTDRHSHILYGVDDGVKTFEDALAVISYEESLGVTDIWCTPHVMEDVPNTTSALKERFAELRSLYNGPVRLHLAAEYMLDSLFVRRMEDDDLLTMEDKTVLVETSTVAPPYDMDGTLERLRIKGYHVLFAHPERCRYLTLNDCMRMRDQGVKFQLNAGSLTGYYGNGAKAKAEDMLKKELYAAYGSDCHRLKSLKVQYEDSGLSKNILRMFSELAK